MKAYLLQLLEIGFRPESDTRDYTRKEYDRAPPVKKTALDVLLGEEDYAV